MKRDVSNSELRTQNQNFEPCSRRHVHRARAGHVPGLLLAHGRGQNHADTLAISALHVFTARFGLGVVELRGDARLAICASASVIDRNAGNCASYFRPYIRDNLTLFESVAVKRGEVAAAHIWRHWTTWIAALDRFAPRRPDPELLLAGAAAFAGESHLLEFALGVPQDPGLVILDYRPRRGSTRHRACLIERASTGCWPTHRHHHRVIAWRRFSAPTKLMKSWSVGHIIEHGPASSWRTYVDSRFAALLRVGLEEVGWVRGDKETRRRGTGRHLN